MPHDAHLHLGHGHGNVLRTGPSTAPFSILRSDLGVRLGFVAVLIAVLWLSVFWALG